VATRLVPGESEGEVRVDGAWRCSDASRGVLARVHADPGRCWARLGARGLGSVVRVYGVGVYQRFQGDVGSLQDRVWHS
jgi:hypothetical protein